MTVINAHYSAKQSCPLKTPVSGSFKGNLSYLSKKADCVTFSSAEAIAVTGMSDISTPSSLLQNLKHRFLKRGWKVKINEPKKEPVQIERDIPVFEYKNIFKKTLKATPNPDLLLYLMDREKKGTIHNAAKAFKRISSLSRYLKEDMVGFITPEGKHWFEGACKYIIKGTAGRDLAEFEYEPHARKFWGLMAKADPYWISDKFVKYLESMNKKDAGVQATLKAIKSLQAKESSKARSSNITFGYNSDIKYIPKLIEDGCAYTGTPFDYYNPEKYPTLEHIFPHSMGGDEVNDDCNYLLTTPESNKLRWHIPLYDYLIGWDGDEYLEAGMIK